MIIYISMLRGINVGAHKRIKMDALKIMYEGMGFENVHTYLQSGNVIFTDEEKDSKKLEGKISSQIKNEFGFDVPIIILSKEKLQDIVEQNPLSKDHQKDESFLHFTFLADEVMDYDELKISSKKQEGEEYHISARAVYLYCPLSYSSTKLNNGFLERILKVQATTRNWKTANALLELSSNL